MRPIRRPSPSPLLVAAAALALLGADVGAAATLTDSKTELFELGPDGTIDLGNTNGDILVGVWDRPEVQVETLRKTSASSESRARALMDDLRSEVEQSGSRLEIEARLPRTRGWSIFGASSASITYVVSVPATTTVAARSTNGDVTVEGVARAVRARTTNGRVLLRGVSGAIDASTTNGGVIADLGGPLREATLSTTNGRVRLHLTEGFGVDLHARAVNGRVHVEVPILLDSVDRRGKSVRGELWGGGAPVTVKTVNGSITIGET